MWPRLIGLFLAGGCGALARYGLTLALRPTSETSFPLGTFVVNVVGCLFFGFVWSLAAERQVINDETRLLLLTGFAGAFTTFSTFAFDSTQLVRSSQPAWALFNIVGQNALGLAAILFGAWLAKLV